MMMKRRSLQRKHAKCNAPTERMMEGWNSPIYAFFHPVPSIEEDKDGRWYHRFHCFAKSCKGSVKRYLDTKDSGSTSNMRKHAINCWGAETVQAAMDASNLDGARNVLANHKDGSIAAAFQVKGKGKVTYSQRQHTRQQTRAEIVRWVAESVRPFSIVKDRGFKCLMKTGRPEYYIPSPTTVARDTRQIFARSRQRIASILRKYEGKIHFATDAWTSPNHRAYVCLTVHLEHKGEPISLILDLVEVPKSHTGVNLAIAFANVLKDFGLSEKAYQVLSITCDNATNNDVMISELEHLLTGFSKVNHTRCFLHVNNLVAQTFVRQFDAPKAVTITDPDDPNHELYDLAVNLDIEEKETEEALLKDLAEGEVFERDDMDGWEDEMAALSQAEREVLLESLRPVKVLLAKVSAKLGQVVAVLTIIQVRKLSYKTIHSTTILLPAWQECLKELKMDIRNIPRDVRTRWNSTYDMLCFVLEYQKAYRRFTAEGGNGLRDFELSVSEWEVVEQLCEILEVRAIPRVAYVIIPHLDTRS
ncbi:hypothetical protein CVT26_004003 [Gymnopilus dilepis]|uniref:BED-type domain-containing protein n=1 Tax=Gymnopilus dilepis TaxID=231916 RepID=A0A409WYH6_9AGAR|nr:hypothetical protein CVT26_004003 [Gymnopilus dilepis]